MDNTSGTGRSQAVSRAIIWAFGVTFMLIFLVGGNLAVHVARSELGVSWLWYAIPSEFTLLIVAWMYTSLGQLSGHVVLWVINVYTALGMILAAFVLTLVAYSTIRGAMTLMEAMVGLLVGTLVIGTTIASRKRSLAVCSTRHSSEQSR